MTSKATTIPGYEMERLKLDETLDRLSDLHEPLIFLILGFLPMRDVVRTSILSKRWKDLWLTLPCLYFHELNRSSADSRDFINRALMLWKGTEIKKLKFTWSPFDASLFGDMDLWMCFVKERKVEELCIQIPYENRKPLANYSVYHPPQCLYSCSSITKLSIGACNLQIRGNVHWHQLKSLNLHGYGFTEAVIDQVVSSCPRLEIFVLILYGSHQSLSFRSTSLKTLSIYTSIYDYPSVLTICAPNLEALGISGAPYDKCLLTDVSSVTDVSLDFVDTWPAMLVVTLTQIIKSFHELHHVEAVTLSACCYKMLTVMNSFSPMMDVKLLRFGGIGDPIEILGLFKIFPKLERLVIDWKLEHGEVIDLENLLQEQDMEEQFCFYYTYPEPESLANMLKPLLMQLKTVEISWYFYEASIFEFVEIMLKHGAMIEKIVIKKRGNKVINSEDMFVASQTMVSLHKSFPNVEMVVCK